MSEDRRIALQVRRARDEDVDALAALHAETFADPWSGDEWRRYISERSRASAASMIVLVGHETGQHAGRLTGLALARRIGDEAEILTIAVATAYRRQGLARQLLDKLIDELGAELPCRLFLEVSVENAEALGLYEAFSFRPVGTRTAYYRAAGGKPIDARILALDLPN